MQYCMEALQFLLILARLSYTKRFFLLADYTEFREEVE
jgi:hypothetical protein